MPQEPPPPPSPAAPARPPAALVGLAGAIRELTETLLRVVELPDALAAEAEAARRRLEALREALAPHTADARAPRFGPITSPRPYYVQGPRLGEHHPAFVPCTIRHEGEATMGSVRFGVTHEGPPGCVHGGRVAHFFDEILGLHNIASGIPAMTASLTVRYLRPTPILTELAFRVESVREGPRKVRTTGRLTHEGETLAEGEGLFVMPRAPKWLEDASPGAGASDAPVR